MNKQRIMLASIAAAVLVGASFFLYGISIMQEVDAQRASSIFKPATMGLTPPGEAGTFIVEIESPYGHETITSFMVFMTENLMQNSGYTMLRLQGPIMDDKRTLMQWVSDFTGKMPDGLAASGTAIGANKVPSMTKPKEGTNIDMLTMSGKVTLKVFERSEGGIYSTKHLRQLEFNNCHIAGYHMGVMAEEKKPYFKDGIQYYEDIVFACTDVKGPVTSNMHNRGMFVETAYNNDNRQITNEKGELMITSREYRQPIVLNNIETNSNTKPAIMTITTLDKTNYRIGDVATFTVTFMDREGKNIDPDNVKAVFNGKIVELVKEDTGIYILATPPLMKEHQQLIVSAEKNGYDRDTSYLSIPIHRIN